MKKVFKIWCIVLILTALFVLLVIYHPPGQHAKPRPYIMEWKCDPPNKIHTNSRGQKICVVYLPDSVYRK